MTKELFQEKFIIWRTKKGSIDILLIAVSIAVLLIIPLFRFFVSAFSTIDRINKAKEILEIASISTYTKLNQDCLGNGILALEKSSAADIFNQQIHQLIVENNFSSTMKNAVLSIDLSNGQISINSRAAILSAFKQTIHVENTVEFIIDPIMEDP